MQDFEQLGAFYLGREFDQETGNTLEEAAIDGIPSIARSRRPPGKNFPRLSAPARPSSGL